MTKEEKIQQTDETDIVKLVTMAKEEIASGKVNYISFASGEQAEQNKILRWIIDHNLSVFVLVTG